MKRIPRLVAAMWFAVAGFILPACWFLPQIIRKSDTMNFLLVIALPILAAGCTGYFVGYRILNRDDTKTARQAIWRGILVSLLAIFIFIPLYTAILVITTFKGNVLYVPAIMGLVATYCVFVAGPLIALISGTAGWLLYRLARYINQAESTE